VAAAVHAGPVRPVLAAFKEHGRTELAGPLGAALALAAAAVLRGLAGGVPAGPVLLVPLPPTAAALRARGRDPVLELADRAAAELRAAGVPATRERLLARRGRVRDSAGLGVAERRANLAGTVALRRGAAVPPGCTLVLLDDVVTTGATLCTATSVLDRLQTVCGTPVLAAAVAAAPPPRRLDTVRKGPGILRLRPT
jgi:predicted amidophosphoribosyltransferase